MLAAENGKKGSHRIVLLLSPRFLSLVDERLFRQIVHNLSNTLLHAQQVGPDSDLGRLGRLVGGRNTGKLLDLAGTGLFVQALGVPLLGLGQRHIDKDFDEGQSVVAGLGGASVQVPSNLSVGAVWRDEGSEGNGG